MTFILTYNSAQPFFFAYSARVRRVKCLAPKIQTKKARKEFFSVEQKKIFENILKKYSQKQQQQTTIKANVSSKPVFVVFLSPNKRLANLFSKSRKSLNLASNQ